MTCPSFGLGSKRRFLLVAINTMICALMLPEHGCREVRPPPESAPMEKTDVSYVDPQSRANNMRNLETLKSIKARGVVPADIPLLIALLTPAVEHPPAEVPKLPEGYAQDGAADMLLALGKDAWLPLMAEIEKGAPNRLVAFLILGRQGQKEAVDAMLARNDLSGTELVHVKIIIGYEGPNDPIRIRQWYAENRAKLTFRPDLKYFVLPPS